VVQRLLFDRVDAESRAAAVCAEHHLAVTVFAHEAKTAIAGLQIAGSRAQVADDASGIVGGVPPARELGSIRQQYRFRR
jgi:hypothetical protein